jgi:hypothetical protein
MKKTRFILLFMMLMSLLYYPLTSANAAVFTINKSVSYDPKLFETASPTHFPSATPVPASAEDNVYPIGKVFSVRGGVKFGMFLDEAVSVETANQSGDYQVIGDSKILFDKIGYDDNNKLLYIITGYEEPDETWTADKHIIKYTGIEEMGEQNSDVYYLFVDDRLSAVLFDLGTCLRTTLPVGAAKTYCDSAIRTLEEKYGTPAYIRGDGDTFNADSVLSDFIRLSNPDDMGFSGQREWYLSYGDEYLKVNTLLLEYFEITSLNEYFTGTIEDWTHVFVSYQYIAPSDVPADVTPFSLNE